MRYVQGLLAVAALIVTDQLSKWWVEASLPFNQAVDLFPFLALYRTHNTGIAFSMLTFLADWQLAVIVSIILAAIVWMWIGLGPGRLWSGVGFALIVGGALGNLVDRVVHGYVIDFILVHAGDWSFAIFNLADSFISIGVVLIVLDELRAVRPQTER